MTSAWQDYFIIYFRQYQQQIRAIARKPRDAEAVCLCLKFADIYHKCKTSQAPKTAL